jgi:hypothetical protein
MRPIGVTITAGVQESSEAWNDHRVPKRILVSALGVVLDDKRIKVAPGVKEGDVLKNEMAAFRMKKTASGNQTFEAWRESEHDDLCLALCITTWWAERMPEPARQVPLLGF